MKTREQKLSDIEAGLKRWFSRGLRAQRAVDKLLKKRRRLLKDAPKLKVKVTTALADDLTDTVTTTLDIPADLKRADPVIAEKMTAARKAAEAAQRKAMPLSGKDAMAAVRRKK